MYGHQDIQSQANIELQLRANPKRIQLAAQNYTLWGEGRFWGRGLAIVGNFLMGKSNISMDELLGILGCLLWCGGEFLMAMYKCASCGKESSTAGACCGAQMKQM